MLKQGSLRKQAEREHIAAPTLKPDVGNANVGKILLIFRHTLGYVFFVLKARDFEMKTAYAFKHLKKQRRCLT